MSISRKAPNALDREKTRREIELLDIKAEQEKLHLMAYQMEMSDRLASDDEHLVYVFADEVYGTSVRYARMALMRWHRQYPGADIEIVFSSPGGEVFAGWMLYDTIRFLSRNGHKMTTVAQGYAASMAGILVQAGDHRVIGAESYLMLHEVATGALGKASQISDAAALAERLTDQAIDVFADRSTLSREAIAEKMTRRDWWLNAQEALDAGFVDEIR